jgi:transcriptional regulator with XRE-family HTH domain
MTKSLTEIMSGLPAERKARVEARAAELIAEEMTLRDLRKARELTQKRAAELLEINQEAAPRLERRSDVLLSTLRGYVEAMGGSLESDVADDALSDLAAVAHGLDELDRASRAIGCGLDAHEHGWSVAQAGDIDNSKYLLGTTTRLDRTATAKSLSSLKSPHGRSAEIRLNRRSQELAQLGRALSAKHREPAGGL